MEFAGRGTIKKQMDYKLFDTMLAMLIVGAINSVMIILAADMVILRLKSLGQRNFMAL